VASLTRRYCNPGEQIYREIERERNISCAAVEQVIFYSYLSPSEKLHVFLAEYSNQKKHFALFYSLIVDPGLELYVDI